jgi:hypothetical protein
VNNDSPDGKFLRWTFMAKPAVRSSTLRLRTTRIDPKGIIAFRPRSRSRAQGPSPISQRIQGIKLLRERAGVQIGAPGRLALQDIGDVRIGLGVRPHGFGPLLGSVTSNLSQNARHFAESL